MITEYAIIETRTRISLFNHIPGKSREIIINSGGPTPTVQDKVRNVLGKKYSDELIEINFPLDEEEDRIYGKR